MKATAGRTLSAVPATSGSGNWRGLPVDAAAAGAAAAAVAAGLVLAGLVLGGAVADAAGALVLAGGDAALACGAVVAGVLGGAAVGWPGRAHPASSIATTSRIEKRRTRFF